MSMWKRRETSDHPSLGAWRGTSNFLHDSKSLMWRWFDEHGPRVSSIRWFKWLMGYIVLWHGRSYLSWEWSSCISDYSSSFLNAAWYLSAGFALTLIFFPFFFFFLIYFWLHWVFITFAWLSLVVAVWGYSLLHCVGFSLQWLLLLQSTGCRHTGFSSRLMQTQELRFAGSIECGLGSCDAQV